MRQVKTLALMIALSLLLCSCTKGGMNADRMAEKIRSEFLHAGSITMTVDVTADYGDNVYDYRLRFEGGTKDGALTVLSPDTIAGLTARFEDGGLTLVYDGASLDTGRLDSSGLSPIDSLPAMLGQWCDGYIAQSTFETMDGVSCAAVTYDVSDSVELRTWFDSETYLPVRAEFSTGGTVVIFCSFDDVILQ